ncbi:MAG: hypothetical protein A3G13_00545 [Candidatus Levybacteria bacterium RIFCSPLOWO2_12_FULL_37_7]|nr:MAG: hypothetical protein A3G13_00545 [Candidatus Levybacteria bacterium RIFCSPLOWO2_12_FULL_37_7]
MRINVNRVWAMIIRYTIYLRHNYDRLTDLFYWPALDLFIWGLTGLYIAKLSNNSSHYLLIILSGLVFWIVVWRSQYEITTNLLSEMWDRNIVNIFASPLKVSEWILAVMVFGFLKTIVSVSFSSILSFIFYRFNIFSFHWLLIPFILSLLATGWAGGFLVAAFIIRYGMKLQTLAWAGIALIAPFSAIYYPVSVLPSWAQTVSLLIPSTYIFESIRDILFTGTVHYDKLVTSFILNAIYLILSLWFFVAMFGKSKKLGLSRLI